SSLVTGLTLLLALVTSERLFPPGEDATALARASATAARLDAIEHLRSQPAEDERFDILVRSLALGVGYDVPGTLADPLRDLQAVRAEERATGRTEATEERTSAALARARQAL